MFDSQSAKPLSGRSIMITGASSGVGRHLAAMLAGQGATVVCCARRADKLDSLVAEIRVDGGQALACECDVSDAGSIAAAFDFAERNVGLVDSVVVNAGINHAGPSLKISVEDLDQILAVNLRGTFLTAREAGKRMIAAPGVDTPKRILFVASILGLRPQAGAAAYSATKAGVVMLARSLALEWARHGISVNALCPGFMPTEIVADWFETEGGRRQIASWPRQRVMPVSDLDAAVTFYLSASARAVTGTALPVDDGQLLAC